MIRIMLVESDKLLCKEYALEIAQDEEFALVAVTGRQSDAINILTEQEVDAVIVNLDKLPPESQQSCIASIEENIEILKTYLEENLREKENDPEIPKTGMAVLQQQIVLADAIEKWIISLKKDF